MRHLTEADYHIQPWQNGQGQTVEMLRLERDGALLFRLSRATVAQNGPFSLFAGIERNLTVISGPGFDLSGGGLSLACKPLRPVAFAGDRPVTATGVDVPSDDFNVMSARALPRPEVSVARAAHWPGRAWLAVFMLEGGQVEGRRVACHDLMLCGGQAARVEGLHIAVRQHGLG